MLNYPCLILDHDDTVVKSTPQIHYPAFTETLRLLRPDLPLLSLKEFVNYCFDPGFDGICNEIYHFTDEEMKIEYAIWKKYTQNHIPEPYQGLRAILLKFRQEGGKIVVISHSESTEIKRDFINHFDFEPDLIYGWELGAGKRKPDAYPLLQTMQILNLKNTDCIMVDDLKLGQDMCRKCDVSFAAAGWSHFIDEISDYLKVSSDFYLYSVDDLANLLFKQ